jgi:flagellar basal body-associated protein FliL
MSNNAGQKSSLGKGGIIAIIVSSVVITALVIVIIVLLKGRDRVEVEKRNVVVSNKNAEEVVDQMALAEYVEPGYYNASMTNIWHFATGDAESEDAYVANVEENTNDVYFDVFLASDEENPILQSPVIPRGAELEHIKLDTPLEAGTYDCVLIYHLVDEEQKPISKLRVGITIIVEK